MVNSKLVEQMREQRRIKVTVGAYTFIARRPTDLEFAQILLDNTGNAEVAQRFVDDWEGVAEADLVNGGGSDEVKFDALVWREWCSDRRDFWEPISKAVLLAFTDRAEKLAAAEKN